MSNNGQLNTRSNYSHGMPTHYQNNVNTQIGGNRIINGKVSYVTTLPDCPCKDICKGGACTCPECTKNIQSKVWTQNIIPVAANIRTSTRHHSDPIRGDIDIISPQAPHGWFKAGNHNRLIEKGARIAVFGIN